MMPNLTSNVESQTLVCQDAHIRQKQTQVSTLRDDNISSKSRPIECYTGSNVYVTHGI